MEYQTLDKKAKTISCWMKRLYRIHYEMATKYLFQLLLYFYNNLTKWKMEIGNKLTTDEFNCPKFMGSRHVTVDKYQSELSELSAVTIHHHNIY